MSRCCLRLRRNLPSLNGACAKRNSPAGEAEPVPPLYCGRAATHLARSGRRVHKQRGGDCRQSRAGGTRRDVGVASPTLAPPPWGMVAIAPTRQDWTVLCRARTAIQRPESLQADLRRQWCLPPGSLCFQPKCLKVCASVYTLLTQGFIGEGGYSPPS